LTVDHLQKKHAVIVVLTLFLNLTP